MHKHISSIRWLLSVFILGLVISGLTAIPLETEMRWLAEMLSHFSPSSLDGLNVWIIRIRDALIVTNREYPFIAYGTDWLAFAHLVIAVAFIGPLRDPVKNVWVIEFGIIACLLVIPFALLMGSVREIPLMWRLVDCSFGVIGVIPLWICHRLVKRMSLPEGK
ncbi:MAG: hypothetical protein FJ405_08570 [Verrucomicrobia bacterium]|nr:hypothetical protein [Verrucomicrobiota bacterium]